MSHVVSTDSDSLSQPNYQNIIIDKGICGCGFTNYCLTNSIPTILVSPRRELLGCKVLDPLTKHAYYFDRSNKKVDVKDSIARLEPGGMTPWTLDPSIPMLYCYVITTCYSPDNQYKPT